ncbi:MAG: hypothetical protein RLZZ298_3289 [Pseudomonadota bacterium]
MLQGLGLSNTLKRFALCFIDPLVDPVDHSPVLLLPVQAIFPGVLGKNQLHFANSRSVPFSAFNWVTAESSRLALAGVRKR